MVNKNNDFVLTYLQQASRLEGTMEGWVDGGVLEDRKTRLIIQGSLQIKFTSSCAIGRFGGEAHTQYVNDSFEF